MIDNDKSLMTRLSALETRITTDRQRFEREIASLREQLALSGGPGEGGDLFCRRAEWTIQDISQKLRDYGKGQSLYSPEFALFGLKGLQLEFFPNGRETANIEGMCSVFFWCTENTHVKYALSVGNFTRAPDNDDYHSRMGHGHSNFCLLAPEVDRATDSVTLVLEILDVQKAFTVGPNLRVIRQSWSDVIGREVAVCENRSVTRVEWRIDEVSRRFRAGVRGASMYSPVFTAAGVKDCLIELYLRGHHATTKENHCAFYLRCPEGTRVVLTMFVGEFKRGPIAANFEGPAGKGIPDFCDVVEQIDRLNDTLLVALEIKNAADGIIDNRRTLLTL